MLQGAETAMTMLWRILKTECIKT
jgi:hypothetical protein